MKIACDVQLPGLTSANGLAAKPEPWCRESASRPVEVVEAGS